MEVVIINLLRSKNTQSDGSEHHNERGHECSKIKDFHHINLIFVLEYRWSINVEVKWEHDHGEDGADGCHGNGERKI